MATIPPERSLVHFVLQGKGGVGKSIIARLLVEHARHSGQKVDVFDADPVNNSLLAVEEYGAKSVALLDDRGEIDMRSFDALVEGIAESDASQIVIDCGAATFLPISSYLDNSPALAFITGKLKRTPIFHTVVTGGPAKPHTIDGFRALTDRFGEEYSIVLWLNRFFGPIRIDDVPFLESKLLANYVKEERILGLIDLQDFDDLKRQDFAEFLEHNISFETGTDDTSPLGIMARMRLAAVHDALVKPIAGILEREEPDE